MTGAVVTCSSQHTAYCSGTRSVTYVFADASSGRLATWRQRCTVVVVCIRGAGCQIYVTGRRRCVTGSTDCTVCGTQRRCRLALMQRVGPYALDLWTRQLAIGAPGRAHAASMSAINSRRRFSFATREDEAVFCCSSIIYIVVPAMHWLLVI
jgi:hypothetical protein